MFWHQKVKDLVFHLITLSTRSDVFTLHAVKTLLRCAVAGEEQRSRLMVVRERLKELVGVIRFELGVLVTYIIFSLGCTDFRVMKHLKK